MPNNDTDIANRHKKSRSFTLIAGLTMTLAITISSIASAQSRISNIKPDTPVGSPRPSTNNGQPLSLEQQYRSCPGGSYAGPRPARTRYTKDTFLWVVTPEFAQRFCMPPEFISEELKGAEAIAYKVTENADEQICGWADNAAVCGNIKHHRYEVYLKTTALLPKKNDSSIYSLPRLPSKALIDQSAEDMQLYIQSKKLHPKLGTDNIFESQQVRLMATKSKSIVWSIDILYLQTFFRDLFSGIDFLAFEGQIGDMHHPRLEKLAPDRFVIAFTALGRASEKWEGRPQSDLPYVIEIPTAFMEKIKAIDADPKLGIEGLAKRAFGVTPNKN